MFEDFWEKDNARVGQIQLAAASVLVSRIASGYRTDALVSA
jgi:hypothetical protein